MFLVFFLLSRGLNEIHGASGASASTVDLKREAEIGRMLKLDTNNGAVTTCLHLQVHHLNDISFKQLLFGVSC